MPEIKDPHDAFITNLRNDQHLYKRSDLTGAGLEHDDATDVQLAEGNPENTFAAVRGELAKKGFINKD